MANGSKTSHPAHGAPASDEEPTGTVPHHHGPECEHQVETFVRPTAKIGRNDPCSCGSGKKYKKCCG